MILVVVILLVAIICIVLMTAIIIVVVTIKIIHGTTNIITRHYDHWYYSWQYIAAINTVFLLLLVSFMLSCLHAFFHTCISSSETDNCPWRFRALWRKVHKKHCFWGVEPQRHHASVLYGLCLGGREGGPITCGAVCMIRTSCGLPWYRSVGAQGGWAP